MERSLKNQKLVIGVITDGKYGLRAYKNIKKNFKAHWILVPEIPTSAILEEDLKIKIPDCDIYISYVRHPDVILVLTELMRPLILGVLPGIGLYKQARSINSRVVYAPTMCSLENNTEIPEVDIFTSIYGKPIFKALLDKDGIFRDILVLRSALCGSSEAGARFLLNRKFTKENLQKFALNICYECRAPRFGQTCDKEVAGLNHLVSLLNGIPTKVLSNSDDDLNKFIENIKEEYKVRMKYSESILRKIV